MGGRGSGTTQATCGTLTTSDTATVRQRGREASTSAARISYNYDECSSNLRPRGCPMEFTELTIRLILLFFPGIICYLIIETLITHKDRRTHHVLLFSLVFGVLSYIVYAPISVLRGITQDADGGLHVPPPSVSF